MKPTNKYDIDRAPTVTRSETECSFCSADKQSKSSVRFDHVNISILAFVLYSTMNEECMKVCENTPQVRTCGRDHKRGTRTAIRLDIYGVLE